MKVFVLMLDGGYDGDALLGVYATAEKAREASESDALAGEGVPIGYPDGRIELRKAPVETYVEPVEVDAPADERQTGIGRSLAEEHRRKMIQRFADQ